MDEGSGEGTTVGLLVGILVGAAVGINVGTSLGFVVGENVEIFAAVENVSPTVIVDVLYCVIPSTLV